MRSTHPAVGLLAALALGFAFHSFPAYACTCAEPFPVPEAKAAADAVFIGRVIEVEVGDPGHTPNKRVVLRVEAIWKGDLDTEATIFTGVWDGDCGFPFELDETFLVYAEEYASSEDPHRLYTGICTRTALAANNPDLKELGPPIAVANRSLSWGRIKQIWR